MFNFAEVIETIAKKLELSDEKAQEGADGYTVYTLVDSEGYVRYVGRTKDYGARMRAHRQAPNGKIYKYNLKEGYFYTGLTEAVARGYEQILMVYCHTRNLSKDPNDSMVNFVNGVGPNNKKSEYYFNEQHI